MTPTCSPLPEGDLPGPLAVVSRLPVDNPALPVPRPQVLGVSSPSGPGFGYNPPALTNGSLGSSMLVAGRIQLLVVLDQEPGPSSTSCHQNKEKRT